MGQWSSQHLPLLIPFLVAGWWLFVIYLIAAASGWRLLARRFRLQGEFTGQKWRMQSARMRWLCSYNNCLNVGGDETALVMAPMLLFRPWHPPLFVPWTEISYAGASEMFLLKFVELRLGRSENIPFKVSASLAAKLQSAAGPAWPTAYSRTMPAPPPIA
jgi:hypothetical protein